MTKIVKLIDTIDDEMLEIIIDKKTIFFGNYWDFSWHNTLPDICEALGATVIRQEYESGVEEDD